LKIINYAEVSLKPALLLLLPAVLTVHADDIYRDAGASAFQFLKIEVSARASALGGTVLLNSGTFSGLSGPAGLMQTSGTSITAGHAEYFGSISQNSASYITGFGGVRLSAALNTMLASDLEYREDEPVSEPLGSFDYLDLVLSGAMAMRFGSVDAGIGAKILREKVWNADDWGYAFDASVTAHPLPWLDMGAAVLNIGPSVDFDQRPGYRLPMTWRAGASAGFELPLAGETAVTVEICKPIDNRMSGGAGLELSPVRWMDLRVGSKLANDSQDLTAGAGFSAGTWTLDYAWIPGCLSLGDIHRVVLSTRL
jgi:hypothetical protein